MASHHHHHHHDQPVDNGPTPPPTTSPGSPTPPAAEAPAFSDLGVTFNDATRLWQNVVEEGGQGNGSIVKYTSDLTAVQTGLTAEVNAGQFSGATLGPRSDHPIRHYYGVVGGKRVCKSAAGTNTPASNGGADASHSVANPAIDPHHIGLTEMAHHFQHVWG